MISRPLTPPCVPFGTRRFSSFHKLLDNSQAWICIQAWLLFYSKRFGSVPLPFSSNLFCYMQVLLLSNVQVLLWVLLTSHSSLLLRLMRPPVRPPRLRCGLFPSIYLPHLLVLPATFGLRCFLPSYPYFPALYVVSVRQVRGLPTASFRFHLTVNTLAVQLCASSLPTRTRDFHPLEPAHGGRTRNRRSAYQSNLLYISV